MSERAFMRSVETYVRDEAPEPVRTATRRGRTGKVTRRGAPAAGGRFEMRLEASQLDRWRAFAKSEGVRVAELVRVAVEHVMRSQPHGWTRTELRRDLEAVIEHTRSVMRDGCTYTSLHGEGVVKSKASHPEHPREGER